MSPIAYLYECDQCFYQYDPNDKELGSIWQCLDDACGSWFDCLWMIEDLAWAPDFGPDYEAEFREEDPLTDSFDPNDYPRLCCDESYLDCRCTAARQMLEDDVKDFLIFNRIEYSDVYESDFTECTHCQLYASNGCIPLRGMLRFYDYAAKLPFFSLTGCKHYISESVEPLDLYSSGKTQRLEHPKRRVPHSDIEGLVYDPDLEGYVPGESRETWNSQLG